MKHRGKFLPTELLIAIFECLCPEDIKNVRRVCKFLNRCSSPYLIRKVYLSSRLKDREMLTRISQHPLLSQRVEDIIYDVTVFEKRWLDLRAYRSLLLGENGEGRGRQSYTPSAVERGHEIYTRDYWEQAALEEYRGPFLTRSMDNYLRPPRFEEMLLDPSCRYQVEEFLPDDLMRLVRALSQMPKVTTIELSDCRWTKHAHRYHNGIEDPRPWDEYTFAIHNKYRRGLEAVVLDPKPWAEVQGNFKSRDDAGWCRGFRVINQALAMTESFRAKKLAVHMQFTSRGLPWQTFQLWPMELKILSTSFRYLESICLSIDLWAKPRGRSNKNPICRLRSALFSARHLQMLRVNFHCFVFDFDSRVPPLNSLFGGHCWHQLWSFTFSNVIISQKAFLDFIHRHRHSLYGIVLSGVLLAPDSWSEDSPEEEFAGLLDWKGFFLLLARCEHRLKYLDITSHVHNGEAAREYHACGLRGVRKFLRLGGEITPSAVCRRTTPWCPRSRE